MTGDRTEAELAHVATAAADAIRFLEQQAIRRRAQLHGPRVVRQFARLNPDQLAEAYRQANVRNPRRQRFTAA